MPTADSRSTSDQAPWSRRPLGRTGLEVTPVCIGGGTLGSMPATFGYEVPADRGVAIVRRVLQGPVNFLDTSADYGDGESERRIGAALAEVGGVPGVAGHIGVAGGPVGLLSRYLRTGAFEVLITHNRWTLVDRRRLPARACRRDRRACQPEPARATVGDVGAAGRAPGAVAVVRARGGRPRPMTPTRQRRGPA